MLVGAVMYWVARFGVVPWILLAAIEGLAAAGTVALILPLRHRAGLPRVVHAAAAWTACEWVRTLGPFGVPWAQLGHSQSNILPVAQWASVGGVEFISFALALVSAALADTLARGRKRFANFRLVLAVAAVLLVLAGLGYGRARAVESLTGQGPKMRVALVQASVQADLRSSDVNEPITPQQREQYMAAHEALTRQAARKNPRLIVWPESAVPGDPVLEFDLRDRLAALARECSAWLVVGAHHYTERGDVNSAFLVSPEGRFSGRYDKVHLVPFGEYVPGRKWLPLLNRYNVLTSDVAPGNHFTVWRLPEAIGPMICFESVFPHISRTLRRRGAGLLVVITNDAWFGKTAAAEQHLQIGRFRAIEQGISVVRAAASGISCAILPDGRVVRRAGLATRQALVADVPVKPVPTAYRLLGPAFPAACLLLACLTALAAVLRKKARHQGRSH